ncbi:hypothetical protein ACNPKZ_10320 [Shewanella algae]|uniref:hypothetical protein n=1 Tax=Shewanella algae TaxID=38313 RepID=UPI003AAE5865
MKPKLLTKRRLGKERGNRIRLRMAWLAGTDVNDFSQTKLKGSIPTRNADAQACHCRRAFVSASNKLVWERRHKPLIYPSPNVNSVLEKTLGKKFIPLFEKQFTLQTQIDGFKQNR